MRPQVNWVTLEERAARMSDAALLYAIRDCFKAGQVADANWRAGVLAADAKDSGYYSDESSVYSRELQRRRSGK